MSNKEIKTVIFTFSVIFFVTAVFFVKNNSNDTYADVIQAIASVFSLYISLGAIYYVYKTYQAQKAEIQRNSRDVEFNRIMDAVYRQLEFTRQIHLNRINDSYGLIKLNERLATGTNFLGFDVIVGNKKRMASLYNMINNVNTFTQLIADDVKLFKGLIYISKLENKEINMLTDIVNNNFLNEYKRNIEDLYNVFTNGLCEREFINILDHGYQLNNVLNIGSDQTEHHKDYLSKYDNILKKLVLIKDFTIANKTEKQIEEYKIKAGING